MPTVDDKEYRDKQFRCPFCLRVICVFGEIDTPFGDTVEGGKCECSAVVILDRTGKSAGECYSDALAFAFDWDYDKAFSDESTVYEEAIVRFNSKVGKFLLGDPVGRTRDAQYIFIRPGIYEQPQES